MARTEKQKKAWRDWYNRNKKNPHYVKFYYDRNIRRRNEIRDFINEYKKGKVCERCKFDDFRALQFHHRDKSKKSFSISIAKSTGFSKKKVINEIEKCELICANCHQIEHLH